MPRRLTKKRSFFPSDELHALSHFDQAVLIPHDFPWKRDDTYPHSLRLARAAHQRARRRGAAARTTPLACSITAARSSLPPRHSRANYATSSPWPLRHVIKVAVKPRHHRGRYDHAATTGGSRRRARTSAAATAATAHPHHISHGGRVWERSAGRVSPSRKHHCCTCTTNDNKTRLDHSTTDARDHNADHTSDVQRVLVCKRTTSNRRKTGAQCVQQERQLPGGNVPLRRVAARASVRTSLFQVGQHFASHATNDV